MKKFTAILSALFLLMTTTATAFASESSVSDKVSAQIDGAVSYLTASAESYGTDDAFDFYTLVSSGADMSKFSGGFINDVKNNLDSNNGKIVTSYGESLASYGSVIMALIELGEDPEDFCGYDILSSFTAMDPTAPQSNAYFYRTIIPASMYCSDETFTTALCDTFVTNNYTMGKGMALYGYYSCDNTAYFINALAPCAEEYPEIMADAFNVLESYHKVGGYYSDALYVTDANADSTALALMAYASVFYYVDDAELDGYFSKVNSIYSELCIFESSDMGVFISSYTGEADYFATKDALMGLEAYLPVAMIQDIDIDDTENNSTENTTQSNNKTDKPTANTQNNTTKTNKSKKSPNTGAYGCTALVCAVLAGIITAGKKTE